uniref:Uncharacterized protein n=1 Tax=Rhizophora mucronata TaxID=61149 RepID=A0A2P2NXB1_RHIMU
MEVRKCVHFVRWLLETCEKDMNMQSYLLVLDTGICQNYYSHLHQ